MNERATHPSDLRRTMRARDFFALAFGSIIGVGWMVLLGGWLNRGGPVGAMLGFLVGGLALIPIVCIYGRLAKRLPGAGSEVAYTAAAFPRGISFATGWAMTLNNAIVCPFEAVALGSIAGFGFSSLNEVELYRVAGQPVFLWHLVLGLAATVAITWVNFRGIRHSTILQNVTTYGLLAIFAIFAVLGLARGNVANLPPYFAHGDGIGGGLRSILAVLPIVPYFMTGFETIPKCSEEARADFSPSRFVWVMFAALAVATFFYVTVIGVVALLEPWQNLQDVPFPTAFAFREAFGWPWLVQLIMVGVVLSLVKVFNGNFLAATRLLFAMGRGDLLGGRLGRVHALYRTPVVAVLVVGGLTAAGTFLGKAVLDPITEVGSLCVAGVWLATSLAYCRGAAGPLSTAGWIIGIAGAVASVGMLVITATDFGRYHWLAFGAWALIGAILWFARRHQPLDPQ